MRRGNTLLVTGLAFLLYAQASMAGISFFQADPFPISPQPDFLAVADVNRDGLDDVVVVSPTSDEVNVLLAAPDQPSRFAPVAVGSFGSKLRRHAVGDLNEDGRPDLAVPDQGADGVWVLLGDPSGNFVNPAFYSLGRIPYAVAISNFDGVRGNDIAVADQRLGNVSILLNDGGTPPRFTRGPVFAVGDDPRTVLAMDVNGDNRDDLVTLNEGGPRVKSISVLIFQGVTAGLPVFSDKIDYGVGENPSQMNAGDVNNDGLLDLVMLNRLPGSGNSDVNILISRGDGVFIGPTRFEVPCPFYTGGAFCRARGLAVGDYDNNGTVDLAVTLTDPRRAGTGAGIENDAMQIFGGRGDGVFVSGPVLRTPKSPVALISAELNGDSLLDLAGGFQRASNVTAFTNASTPGTKGNGDECFLGDECLSSRCTNGVCCATQCEDNEICNVPGREGFCQPVVVKVECFDDLECVDIPNDGDPGFCADNFCCDERCAEGRCDIAGFEGLCIPAFEDGEECLDDRDCQSGFCTDGRCCKERCDDGNCENDQGICSALSPNGDSCDLDEQCSSGICDPFVAICCAVRCRTDQDCSDDGESCVNVGEPDRPNGDVCEGSDQCISGNCVNDVCCASPSCPAGEICLIPDGECGPEPTPAPNGQPCSGPGECVSGNCVNEVCCVETSCPAGNFCALGSGLCEEGTPPPTRTTTPTQTATPTGSPGVRTPTPRECGGFECPGRDKVCSVDSQGPFCAAVCGTGTCGRGESCSADLCVVSVRKSGCAVTRDGSVRDLWLLLLVPAFLVLARRGERRRLARARARRQ